jgi:hypothetical protein
MRDFEPLLRPPLFLMLLVFGTAGYILVEGYPLADAHYMIDLSARALNPTLQIVARANADESIPKLLRFRADRVVS